MLSSVIIQKVNYAHTVSLFKATHLNYNLFFTVLHIRKMPKVKKDFFFILPVTMTVAI